MKNIHTFFKFLFTAYEYVPDSEIASVTVHTAQSGSEEDLLIEKVYIKCLCEIMKVTNVLFSDH